MSLSIAVHQLSFKDDKKSNLYSILSYIDNSLQYLNIFPEYCMGLSSQGLTKEYVHKNAETIDGEFVSKIVSKTLEKECATIFTTYLKEKGEIYNAAILTEKGKIKAIYKKIHLFDAFGYRESEIFSPGQEITVLDFQDFKLGLAICFDLRFPELFRIMAYKGVNLFVVPSGWYKGQYKVEQWKTLTSSRAHENVSFLVAVDQTGPLFIGHSVVVSPYGYLIKECGEEEGCFYTKLDVNEICSARKNIPVISLSKPDIYMKFYNSVFKEK
ncbi:MAG: nitrilase-related carbon-nitrogen hydrolase [Nitrososphaeria archaeon]